METQLLVDRMNEEMDKNETLRQFLLSIYNAFVKVGKPIARSILIEHGATKKDLDRLVRAGFLRETKLRHAKTNALFTCVLLPPDVIFFNRQAVAVVEDVAEETEGNDTPPTGEGIAEYEMLAKAHVVGD